MPPGYIKPCLLLKISEVVFKLIHIDFKSVWGQKNLELTELCSAGIYLSPSALCVISLLHKENLPGIWMDGPCQRPPGLSASHQSEIHLISSKPWFQAKRATWHCLPSVVILIADVILILGEKQVKYWIKQVNQCTLFTKKNLSGHGNSSLASHTHGYWSLWLNLPDTCLLGNSAVLLASKSSYFCRAQQEPHTSLEPVKVWG